MKLSFFIARRLDATQGTRFSKSVARLTIFTTALGTAILFIAFGVLEGFRAEVKEKVFSFGGHITIEKISDQQKVQYVSSQDPFFQLLRQDSAVASLQFYTFRPALIQTKNETEGIVLKGVSASFLPELSKIWASAPLPPSTNPLAGEQIVVSSTLAKRLQIKPGQSLNIFFLQDPPRFRKVRVSGIYETGLEEYDENIVLTDNRVLQEILSIPDTSFLGCEVYLKDFTQLDQWFDAQQANLTFDLAARKITDTQIQIFDWLDVIGRNVQIMLVLICVVACFNAAGTVLILMLEKARLVGILKSLGMPNGDLRLIFMLLGLRTAGLGILIGNLVGLLLSFAEWKWHFVPLDPMNYYVAAVPIGWNVPNLLSMNLALLLALSISLLIPGSLAARISPAAANRFK